MRHTARPNRDSDSIWPAVVALGAALLGVGLVYGPSTVRRVAGSLLPSPPLSRRRERALQIIADVVPSQYPDERWRKLAPSYAPDDSAWRESIRAAGADPDRYTTCGELPGYLADMLGARGGLERRGLASVMAAGKAHGAWVEAGDGRRPLPGDILVIGGKDGSISHVSVAVETRGDTWRTADAGQGPRDKQASAYVEREWNERTGMLGGPKGSAAAPRYLIGWVNIDRYPIDDERKAA